MFKKCDVLIPCALEMAIHKGNVEKIQAKLIVEGANGCVSHAAAQYFLGKNIVVVPDVLAGTGSLIASYYEYLCNIDRRKQSLTITRWEEKSKLTLLASLQAVFQKADFKVNFEKIQDLYMQGPQEIDLLFGLIETCTSIALEKAMVTCQEKDIDFRTACWHNGIVRINEVYDVKHGDRWG